MEPLPKIALVSSLVAVAVGLAEVVLWWRAASPRRPLQRALRALARTLTPFGWRNLALQVGIFAVLGGLYALTGLYGRREVGSAIANSHAIVELERDLGIAFEGSLQRWALGGPRILQDVANETYFGCQFVVSTVFLLWVYARRTQHFALVRDALVAGNLVAIVTAIGFPAAPPRMVQGSGIIDTLEADSVNMHSGLVDALNNAYSALPSLHASYAVVIGAAGVALARHWWVRLLWALYPVLVFYSIVATGNHYVLDAAAGVLALVATPLVTRASRGLARRHSRTQAGRSLGVVLPQGRRS